MKLNSNYIHLCCESVQWGTQTYLGHYCDTDPVTGCTHRYLSLLALQP